MKAKYTLLILMGFIFCCTTNGFAQNQAKTITGTVTDAQTGNPLVGVNILVVGTTTGTVTDVDGHYSLSVSSLQDSLRFSYIGFKTKTVPINGRTMINVEMKSKVLSGQELVVVGFGTKQKELGVVQAVSTVSGKELMKSPAMNVGNMLAGKATGITIVQPSGLPGGNKPRIYIRGIHTLGNGAKRPNQQPASHPLFIVDGVQRDIFQLNPANIKSISILKGPAATAVYGIRGANGVVVVTTKQGRKGPARITLRSSVGVQHPTSLPDFINSYTYATLWNDLQARAQIQAGVDPDDVKVRFSPEAIEAFKTGNYPQIYPPGTDWVRLVTKPYAWVTRNSLQVNGGTDDVLYFISGSYANQRGLFKNFGLVDKINPSFKKFTLRSNLQLDMTPSTRVFLRAYTRYETRRRINDNKVWPQLYHGSPYAGVGIINGKVVTSGYGKQHVKYIPGKKEDPLLRIYGHGYRLHTKTIFNIDLKIRQNITKGLSLSFMGSYNSNFIQNRRRGRAFPHYLPYFKVDVDPTVLPGDPQDSSIVYRKRSFHGTLNYNESYNKSQHWLMKANLSYTKDFRKHSVTANVWLKQTKRFFANGKFKAIPVNLSGVSARVHYNYDNRYLLEFDMGYNGSAKFAKGQRFGFFPAAAAGWIVTGESFMDNIHFLDFLKLRASYGLAGAADRGGRFLYLPTTYQLAGAGYNFGYQVSQNTGSAKIGTLGNPDITWATTYEQNYSVDMRLFNSQLNIKASYYRYHRDDILITRNSLPIFVTDHLRMPRQNAGKFKKHGYELKIDWNQSVGRNFSYSIGAHLTHNENEIVYKDEIQRQVPWLRRTGEPVGQPFGYVFNGYYTKEILNNPNSGAPIATYTEKAHAGWLMFRDLNGDGKINSLDKRPVGYPKYPEYIGGATLTFRFKNFFLRTNWMGVTHVSRILQYEPYRSAFGPAGRGEWSTYKWQIEDAWKPGDGHNPNDPHPYPRLSNQYGQLWNNMDADMWVKDASYLRLKNALIGYNFSNQFLKNIGLQKMTVYISGYNLLTFSPIRHYSLDPEQDTKSGRADYPNISIYKIGVNVTF